MIENYFMSKKVLFAVKKAKIGYAMVVKDIEQNDTF